MSSTSCTICIGQNFLFEVRSTHGAYKGTTYWFSLLNAITYCNITKQEYVLKVYQECAD